MSIGSGFFVVYFRTFKNWRDISPLFERTYNSSRHPKCRLVSSLSADSYEKNAKVNLFKPLEFGGWKNEADKNRNWIVIGNGDRGAGGF
jgi:hypothetical protein